ncbi:sodium:proton antiporter [Fulvivirga sp. M361]|uniref:cation:proton antiporter n=1 Tax=Fulvivirga sp. M361 TaxID=2594266 RepID=UPI00117AD538|nr:sodium:proton antiporter [Fulvivirga sp. M361]TRX48304.1 sodium:proton antiporter [Fulvivirga sp. M361]
MFQSFTILLSISALFSYINHKWLKLPVTIGLMIMAMVMSVPMGLLEIYKPEVFHQACQVVVQINFKTFLLDVILSILLFAGALHIKVRDLNKERASVIAFATAGVLISTFIVGFLFFYTLQWIGHPIPLVYALLFGALISPTDPVAVLAILKESNVAHSLETKIAGESLFNDGVGVVVFVSILGFTGDMESVGVGEVVSLFAEEALGGIIYGLVLGYVGYLLLHSVTDDPKVEVLLSLALVLGGYSLASTIHVSGPLAMVVAGLFIGNKLNSKAFDRQSRDHLSLFWEMLDEILNALLFVLIGLEILTLSFENYYFLVGALAIIITLLGRWLSVMGTYQMIGRKNDEHPQKTILILSWGGLRGAISVALALSIDAFEQRELLVFITYCIVVFSIVVQGLSIKTLVNKLKLSKE